MKKCIILLIAMLLLTTFTACRKMQPADTFAATTSQPAPTETMDTEAANDVQAPNTMTDLYTDIPESSATNAPAIERQDGERFEAVIILDGLEMPVRYEHIRNGTIGFEMDYDYELFDRQSDPVSDRFVLIYDDPEDLQNYFEVQYSGDDAETVAASVIQSLSDDYEIIRQSYTLDRAGSCIRIGASEVKGGGYTADQMQRVYIIPADDGCRIATAHYSAENAEGVGGRVNYMMNTFKVIDRSAEPANAADIGGQNGAFYGERSEEEIGGWTGADFGELTEEEIGGQDGAFYGERSEEEIGGWTGADFGELTEEEIGGQDGAFYGERSEEEIGGWTGADFGELPDEDFGG